MDKVRSALIEDIKKRLGRTIREKLVSGLPPSKAIPAAIVECKLNIAPESIKNLIEIHEKEIERLQALSYPHTEVISDGEFQELKAGERCLTCGSRLHGQKLCPSCGC